MNMKEQLDKIVSDDLINRWWYGQWGDNPDKREIMRDGLAQIAAGFSTGNTITTILRDLGLIRRSGITAKGRRYLFWANEYSIYIRRARIAELEAAHKCHDCGSDMTLECSGLTHFSGNTGCRKNDYIGVVPEGWKLVPIDPADNQRRCINNLMYACGYDDISEYVVMPPIRKAEDGTLTTKPQKVEEDDWRSTRGILKPYTLSHPKQEPQKVEVVDVDKLANFIRITNGENKMGAGQLAEKICEYLTLSHPKPAPPPIDIDALKREVCEKYACDIEVETAEVRGIICMLIDHLASAGYLRAPLPRIEGLEEALKKYEYIADQEDWELSSEQEWYPVDEFKVRNIVRAARAYLKSSGVCDVI